MPRSAAGVARVVLAAFVLTFVASRVLIFMIMSRRVPDLYVHAGGTHVHHLNYGIFLLSAVGGYLLFRSPGRQAPAGVAVAYGVGLALTFDEFGMWLHLGGGYWQRASFDAVVVIAALLGLVAVAPALGSFRRRHWAWTALLLAAVAVFGVLLADSLRYAGRKAAPVLERLERTGPQ